MDIQLEKIELIKLLKETQNPSIITEIKKIFQIEEKDFWDELTPSQQSDILEGIREAEEGKIAPYQDVMKKYL
jgi:predicted transcriptional regulator